MPINNVKYLLFTWLPARLAGHSDIAIGLKHTKGCNTQKAVGQC